MSAPRRFAIVKPEVLWTGFPGNALRTCSADVFKVATYLLTGPGVDLWGIWHLEAKIAGMHLGLSQSRLKVAFESLEEIRWAFYQDAWVYVPDLPATQFPRWPLSLIDNNVRSAKIWYDELPPNPFLGPWFDRHLVDLSLLQDPHAVTRRGEEAPQGPPTPSGVSDPEFDLLGERIVAKPLSAAELDEWFERIAAIYPKKEKLHRARVSLAYLRPTDAQMQEIWTALAWQTRQTDWQKQGGRFAPSLPAYFKDKRWLDTRRATPRLNESTVEAIDAVRTFVNEDLCEAPEKKRLGSALPSRRSRS